MRGQGASRLQADPGGAAGDDGPSTVRAEGPRPAGGGSLEMSEIADLRARNRDIGHLGAGRRRRRRPEELIVLIEVVDPAERVLEVAVVRDHGQHAGEVEHPLDGRVLGDTEQVQPAVDPVVVA